jgi:hypothetical protein
VNSQIYSNSVRTAIFPSPPWETHVLLVACRAVVLLSWEAQCQSWTPRSTPTLCALQFSHGLHRRLTFCSLLAGRWCPCWGWHSVNRGLPDLLQHRSQIQCARSSSKVPSIAPMGKLLTCLPRLTLAQLRPKLSGQLQSVRAAETLKTSQFPDGKIADLLDLTHTCTTANDASVNYRMYVPQ